LKSIAVVGAGITGVMSAYALRAAGYDVSVIDRHRYPAMETSFANGGQLSASNAEVWNCLGTVFKGLRWMLRRDAPLLLKPAPTWHKYSWLAEFLWNVPKYRENTIRTVQLAIAARKRLFEIAESENISFDLERRGILHIFHDRSSYEAGRKVNELLRTGGLERHSVSPHEIERIEPALKGKYAGGFYTPSDASGDIYKFTRGLAAVCARKGVRFIQDANVEAITKEDNGYRLSLSRACPETGRSERFVHQSSKIVICAGVESRRFAAMVGDRVNVYPVKGYSITVNLADAASRQAAPHVSLLDEAAKIVTSRLGPDRFRIAGTAELNGFNRDIQSDRIVPLQNWVRANFPSVDTSTVVPWAGLRPMMPNMMPLVCAGRRPGIFYNTGHGHLGWTLSAATADLLVALVERDILPNRWLDVRHRI
jgi:D-amino-acid dehydrogenase